WRCCGIAACCPLVCSMLVVAAIFPSGGFHLDPGTKLHQGRRKRPHPAPHRSRLNGEVFEARGQRGGGNGRHPQGAPHPHPPPLPLHGSNACQKTSPCKLHSRPYATWISLFGVSSKGFSCSSINISISQS